MIGWYVHHHGSGHLQRARAVIARMRSPVTAFGSLDARDVVRLPDDVGEPHSKGCAVAPPPSGFHYAPLGVDGIRARMAWLAAWVEEADPDVVVVDVSVEVADLMRLLGVPTVLVRQHGVRVDPAHARGYANASCLLAPFPAWLESTATPWEIRQRTCYVGGFSRFDGHAVGPGVRRRAVARALLGLSPDAPTVVVTGGDGGPAAWPVARAAAATPSWRWHVLGRGWGPEVGELGVGWVPDPAPWLEAADVVITHAGHNAVMECAALGCQTIVIPLDRPFAEQLQKARLLHRHGVMTVRERWPEAGAWAALLAEAHARPRSDRVLVDGDGAARAAEVIERTAARMRRSPVAAALPA